MFSFAALLGLAVAGSTLSAQDRANPGIENTTDITKFLNEKERDHLAGKRSIEDLTGEEREHVQRILRLQNLRNEEDIVNEPAGAEAQVAVSDTSASTGDALLDEAEELRRENSRLRMELRRLQSQMSDLRYQPEDPQDMFNEPLQRRPRFYMPVR